MKCESGKRFESRQQQDVESGLNWHLAARLQQSSCPAAGVLALKLRSSMGTERCFSGGVTHVSVGPLSGLGEVAIRVLKALN